MSSADPSDPIGGVFFDVDPGGGDAVTDRLCRPDAWPWLAPWLSVARALLDVGDETDGDRDRSPPIIVGTDPTQRAIQQASVPTATTSDTATVDTR